MALSTISITITPGSSAGEMMKEIRTWLDHNKVEPSLFKQADFAFEISFSRDEEAELFKSAFNPR